MSAPVVPTATNTVDADYWWWLSGTQQKITFFSVFNLVARRKKVNLILIELLEVWWIGGFFPASKVQSNLLYKEITHR